MENAIKFRHRVSKGSRYNQIYVPIEMQRRFKAGSIVEVRLIESRHELFLHNVKLTEFKERLIKEIFNFLGKYSEIEQIFIFGSFLTEKTGYNDIDIFLITDKERDEKYDNKILINLSEEFNLKFHVISGARDKLIESFKFSPPMRSMFYNFVSNKNFSIPKERIIDKNHLLLLMMGPKDLLTEEYFDSGRIYYEALRKLLGIIKFIAGKDEDISKINEELYACFGRDFIIKLKNDDFVSKDEKKKIREFISEKLKIIEKRLKNEQVI